VYRLVSTQFAEQELGVSDRTRNRNRIYLDSVSDSLFRKLDRRKKNAYKIVLHAFSVGVCELVIPE
jgi:hypothetical protein